MNRSENDNAYELMDIIPYKDNGIWFFKLLYKKEDEIGNEWIMEIPRIENPFFTINPRIDNEIYGYYRMKMRTDEPLIYLVDGVFATSRQTKSVAREMTINDIEKELGYKVKIIGEESKKDAKKSTS